MPIQSGDIHLKLSTTAGSSGNSNNQTNPNNSLGKFISSTDIINNTLGNLFDDISGDENAASTTDYRCIFVHNAHASLTLQSPKLWLSGVRCTVSASTDKFSAVAHGFVNGDAVRLDAEYATDTIPTGVNNSPTYFVVSATSNDFKLSATLGGSAIDITVDGTVAVRQYSNTTITFAIDSQPASQIGQATIQADTVANELTAPTGVGSFSGPTTKSAGLVLSDIPAGSGRAFWVKRVALNNGARNNDGMFVRVEGDTAA